MQSEKDYKIAEIVVGILLPFLAFHHKESERWRRYEVDYLPLCIFQPPAENLILLAALGLI